jgi:DNA mismatch repair protein MutS2
VDIGDEQSIEQSHSTFSSHMVNVVDIISKVTERSLIVLDELGSGTDPIEGAALAISILEFIRKKGAVTAVTTHYAELKAYALESEGVQNACCEFDINTLKPTFKIIVGMPGKSNAFAISEKLGLPIGIVSDAKSRISEENRNFEYVLGQLEKTRIETEQTKQEAEKLRAEYESFKAKAEENIRIQSEKSEKEIKKTREKAKQLIDSARATSEFVFKELETIKKKQDSKNFSQELAKARQEIRNQLRDSTNLYYETEEQEFDLDEEYTLPRPLKQGDKVFLVEFKQEGEVLEAPNANGFFQVRAGILKTKAHISKVRLIESDKKKKPKQKNIPSSPVKKPAAPDFKPETDVRGMILEDAWQVVDKYLDDAIMASMHSVRIIHGKGTGALRNGIQNYLRTDKRVLSYRHGEFGEGDFGVTVVELK